MIVNGIKALTSSELANMTVKFFWVEETLQRQKSKEGGKTKEEHTTKSCPEEARHIKYVKPRTTNIV